MKEKILKLRSEGKTYKEIKEILGCAKSTISFHCSTEEMRNKYKKKEVVLKIPKIKKIKKARVMPTYEEFIRDWKLGLNSGGKGDLKGHGKVSNHVRKYLFIKYNSCCANCKWSKLNIFTNSIPLEVDHINGNPMDHREDNLILLCPNCHSLKNTNSTSKGNGRRYYREKYHKEKFVDKERLELSKPKGDTFTEC